MYAIEVLQDGPAMVVGPPRHVACNAIPFASQCSVIQKKSPVIADFFDL
jgi:hypothetical protein